MMFASSPFVTDTLSLVYGVLMKWSCHLESSKSAWLSQNAKRPYQIIVADAADAVSVNFSGRCKFLQI